VSPELNAVIEAADDLAWRPTSNTSNVPAYRARKASHQALCDALARLERVDETEPVLLLLVAAIRRAACCNYCNRMGPPYYARKQAIYQLRGCLDVWHRLVIEGAS
jgi:hypothetical protein